MTSTLNSASITTRPTMDSLKEFHALLCCFETTRASTRPSGVIATGLNQPESSKPPNCDTGRLFRIGLLEWGSDTSLKSAMNYPRMSYYSMATHNPGVPCVSISLICHSDEGVEAGPCRDFLAQLPPDDFQCSSLERTFGARSATSIMNSDPRSCVVVFGILEGGGNVGRVAEMLVSRTRQACLSMPKRLSLANSRLQPQAPSKRV
jgi:hypothetical protein